MSKKSLRDVGRALEEEHNMEKVESTFFPASTDEPAPNPVDPTIQVIERLQFFKAKLDYQVAHGIEPELTKEEQEELNAIAEVIVEALQPFIALIQEVAKYITDVFLQFMETDTFKALMSLSEHVLDDPDRGIVKDIEVVPAQPLTGKGGYAFDIPVGSAFVNGVEINPSSLSEPIVRSDSIGLRDAARDANLDGMRY